MDMRRDEEVQDAVFDVAGVITRYVYDNEDILLEYDGANVLLARYTHGPVIDEPLVMERDVNGDGLFAATERFHYHIDGLGSVTDITDNAGTVVRAYAYGQIVAQTGALENPYIYTGRELDAESGLYFYRARYYDAVSGRFISEDPIGLDSGPNIYAYVENNPLNATDPTGELAWFLVPIIGGGCGQRGVRKISLGPGDGLEWARMTGDANPHCGSGPWFILSADPPGTGKGGVHQSRLRSQ